MHEEEKHKKAYELARVHGLSKRQIAQELGVSVGTITHWSSGKCKCPCGYHNWSENDLPIVNNELSLTSPGESAVVQAEVLEVKNLLVKIVQVIKSKIEDGSVAPRNWSDVLDTLEVVKQFRDLFSFLEPGSGSEIQLSEERRVKFKDLSPAEIDRFADLFLRSHVVEGESVLEKEAKLVEVEEKPLSVQFEDFLKEIDETE